MSMHSKNQRLVVKPQTPNLPTLKMLTKNKKYKYQDHKEIAAKHDIDLYIHHLVNKENSPCPSQLVREQSIINRMDRKHQKFMNGLQFLQCSNPQTKKIKQIRIDLHKYIGKLGKFPQSPSSEYLQFVRLSQQSLDYLQYYLKNHFKEDKDMSMLQKSDKQIILSMLKNNYKCLTDNPPEIANRIMLSLGINPLNDFHFIQWQIFSKFRKIAQGTQNKMETKNFINKQLIKGEFWGIVSGIIRKLQRVMNLNNVEHLIERIQEYGNVFIPEIITTKDLQKLIISEHFFVWDELIQLIFIV